MSNAAPVGVTNSPVTMPSGPGHVGMSTSKRNVAGAGTGKSSISAAMLAGEVLGPCAAAHFLKYSDQRRLEPVAVVKNMAFQLAIRCGAGGVVAPF